MVLLPFTALGWLGLGFIAAGVLRPGSRPASRRWAGFSCRQAITTLDCTGTLMGQTNRRNHPGQGDDIRAGRPGRLDSRIEAILIFGRPK